MQNLPDSTFSTAGQISFFVTKHFRYQPDTQKSPTPRNREFTTCSISCYRLQYFAAK